MNSATKRRHLMEEAVGKTAELETLLRLMTESELELVLARLVDLRIELDERSATDAA